MWVCTKFLFCFETLVIIGINLWMWENYNLFIFNLEIISFSNPLVAEVKQKAKFIKHWRHLLNFMCESFTLQIQSCNKWATKYSSDQHEKVQR